MTTVTPSRKTIDFGEMTPEIDAFAQSEGRTFANAVKRLCALGLQSQPLTEPLESRPQEGA